MPGAQLCAKLLIGHHLQLPYQAGVFDSFRNVTPSPLPDFQKKAPAQGAFPDIIGSFSSLVDLCLAVRKDLAHVVRVILWHVNHSDRSLLL